MYVRLAFAVAAHLDCDVLIVDEVLAVGDEAFQRKCLGKMNEVVGQGRTVLFVSHNMSAVTALTTRSLVFEHGRAGLRRRHRLKPSSDIWARRSRSNGDTSRRRERPHRPSRGST